MSTALRMQSQIMVVRKGWTGYRSSGAVQHVAGRWLEGWLGITKTICG